MAEPKPKPQPKPQPEPPPAPKPKPEPPPVLPWQVRDTQCLLFPNAGGARLTLVLDLPEAFAAPFRQVGEQRFQQLRATTRESALQLREATLVRDAVRDPQKRSQLPQRLADFRQQAEALARTLRLQAIALAEEVERTLGGCLANVGQELGKVIAAGVFLGCARGVQDFMVVNEWAEALVPPPPALAVHGNGRANYKNPFEPVAVPLHETGALPVVPPPERRRKPPPDAVRPPVPVFVTGQPPLVLSDQDRQAQQQVLDAAIRSVEEQQAAATEFARRAAEVAALQRRGNGGKS
jgi:hypothetical protein